MTYKIHIEKKAGIYIGRSIMYVSSHIDSALGFEVWGPRKLGICVEFNGVMDIALFVRADIMRELTSRQCLVVSES